MFEPIKKSSLPDKLIKYNYKSNSLPLKDTQTFINKIIGKDFFLLTRNNIKKIKLNEEYYGIISQYNILFEDDKLEKIKFQLNKTGHLKIRVNNKYNFYPWFNKDGILVSSNAEYPVIIRAIASSNKKTDNFPKFRTKKSSYKKGTSIKESKKGLIDNLLSYFI